MHPRKAEVLASMDESFALVDRAIARNVRIIGGAQHHSWGQLGVALVTLPFYALAAGLADLSYIMTARSADEAWDRLPASDSQLG